MGLDKQVFISSVGTDSLYEPDERLIHDRMLRLYKLRAKDIPAWKKSAVNRLLKKHKEELTEILDSKVGKGLVRELNKDAVCDKTTISLFESALTRACGIKTNEKSDKLFQIEFFFYQVMNDLIFNGFNYNGEHYVYFSSSAGSIRKHRGLFIEEELYKQIQPKLTCGLTPEHVNETGGCVINKWLSYNSLSSSATDIWEDFDIDKTIVCDDKEIDVWGDMDYISDTDYSITRKYTSVSIPLNDGVGMMLPKMGASRVCRLPFVKGALVAFDFRRFLLEKCTPEQYVVKDIYGTEHNVIEEDIQVIFTKSQTKMWKHFDSWKQYQENFKKYGCEAGYCNVEQETVPKAKINYQMLNSLHDMTDDEIDSFIKQTVEEIESIGNDYQTTMKVLGANKENEKMNSFQKAITLYPELFKDPYSKEILKQTKKSYVKQAKAGRIRINSLYRLACSDLYAYCEWLFQGIDDPQGLLKPGEVAISEYKDGEELDVLRSPHLYFEHCLRTNNQSEEVKKWFDTKCIYTASHDNISRILALD